MVVVTLISSKRSHLLRIIRISLTQNHIKDLKQRTKHLGTKITNAFNDNVTYLQIKYYVIDNVTPCNVTS